MDSSLMATQSVLSLTRHPVNLSPATNRRVVNCALPTPHTQLRRPFSIPRLLLHPILKPSKLIISSSASAAPRNSEVESTVDMNPARDLLSGSTRTATTLVAVAFAASKFLFQGLFRLAVQLKEPILSSAGPAFFAAFRDAPPGRVSTPLTVVAAGMAKWLDLYSAVLLVRVLLSWFPNIPWDRQPLSAIRDLCDPYLSLFRNIIPPVFDTLDISPLFAFTVLGALGAILDVGSSGY